MNAWEIFLTVWPHIAGYVWGGFALAVVAAIHWIGGLSALQRKHEALLAVGAIAGSVLLAWKSGESNWPAMLDAAGKAAVAYVLSRSRGVKLPVRSPGTPINPFAKVPDPPRTEEIGDEAPGIEVELDDKESTP